MTTRQQRDEQIIAEHDGKGWHVAQASDGHQVWYGVVLVADQLPSDGALRVMHREARVQAATAEQAQRRDCCHRTIGEYTERVWPIEGPTNLQCSCGVAWTYRAGEWNPRPPTSALPSSEGETKHD